MQSPQESREYWLIAIPITAESLHFHGGQRQKASNAVLIIEQQHAVIIFGPLERFLSPLWIRDLNVTTRADDLALQHRYGLDFLARLNCQLSRELIRRREIGGQD